MGKVKKESSHTPTQDHSRIVSLQTVSAHSLVRMNSEPSAEMMGTITGGAESPASSQPAPAVTDKPPTASPIDILLTTQFIISQSEDFSSITALLAFEKDFPTL